MTQRVPRAESVFLQTSSPTPTCCGGYDSTASSTKSTVVQQRAPGAFRFHSTTVIGRTLLDNCTPASAAAFGESHTGERRHHPRTCCRWLAEHCQLVYHRLAGTQNNRSSVAHELGRRASFFGQRKRISKMENAVAPGRRPRIPGLCLGGQLLQPIC